MDIRIVGTSVPASGTGGELWLGVAVGFIVAEGDADIVGVGEGVLPVAETGVEVGVVSGVAEGVDSKAGPSAACTTKVLVID